MNILDVKGTKGMYNRTHELPKNYTQLIEIIWDREVADQAPIFLWIN
jgi:hypothetical protein